MTGYERLLTVLRAHPKIFIGGMVFSLILSAVSFSGVASHLRTKHPDTIKITKQLDELLITLRKTQATLAKDVTLEDVEIKGDIKTIE